MWNIWMPLIILTKNKTTLDIMKLIQHVSSFFILWIIRLCLNMLIMKSFVRGHIQCDTGSEPYFGKGTKVTVLEKDPISPKVTVLEPSPKECRNKKKTLVCVASNFYPDHVSVFWKTEGTNATDGVVTDNAALKGDDGNYMITSRLRVSAEEWFTPNRNFTCIVSFYNGETTVDYSASVYGVEAPAAGRTVTRDDYLWVTNAAKLTYGVFIVKSCMYGAFVAFLVWKLQGSTGKQNN